MPALPMWVWVALSSAAITAFQLWRRFLERRPFSTLPTAGLFVFICALSGGITAFLSSVTLSRLGLVAVVGAYPFWAPRPTDQFTTEPTESGGQSTKAGAEAKSFVTQVTNVLWAVAGALTERLDDKLAARKSVACRDFASVLATSYYRDAGPDPYPLFERIQAVLKQVIEGGTDVRRVAVRKSRLRSAYESAGKRQGDIAPLVALIYDWRLEETVRDVVDDSSRTVRPQPPPEDTD